MHKWDYLLMYVSSNLCHSLSYSLSYNLHQNSEICTSKHLLMILIIKVITLWISSKGSEKWWRTIIDLTMSIKVWFFSFIPPFCNRVLSAHNWDIIPCTIRKESNSFGMPPRSNQSALICLPKRLSSFTLNSMNLSKASNFLCT